jgi:histidinol-phosphate aminotransferase
MTGYTPGEQPKRAGLIKLNTNENPYPPSPRVAEALGRLDPRDLRLYPDPVSSDVRQAIAKLHGVAMDQVLVGNGSDEILALCTRAFVEDDEAIGYFDPSYSLYPVLAAIRNVPGVPCALSSTLEWPERDPEQTALFFLANPNAPTSLRFPDERVSRFCRGFNGVVLIDEAYVDFADGDCMELAKTLPNVLVMRTLSKSYSLAGIRFGYVVGSGDLIGALDTIKDSYNLDRMTQALALAAITDQSTMKTNVAKIKATRERLTRELTRRGFEVCKSETNFLWVRPVKMKAQAVFEQLKAAAVLIRYFPGERTGEYVRITVGTDEEINRLLDVLPEEG